MKTIKSIPILAMAIQLCCATLFGQKPQKTESKGFAVVELFTSEGCSSCPPADELMGKIQNDYKDRNVYVIAYHVDYWDHQGWKDVFGSADYTKRQYEYADWFRLESIYTPQAIINGKEKYVGSQEPVIRNAIKKALLKPSVANLDLKATLANNKLTANYTVIGHSKNSRLLLAVVQKNAQTAVKRGENANHILSQFQIVRHLHSTNVAKDGNGTTTISLPKDFNTKDFEVVGFVQDMDTGVIAIASKVPLLIF